MRRAVMLMLALAGCATLRQVAALRQVDFELASVAQGRLAGIDLERIQTYQDLGAADAVRIGAAISARELPLEFTVNVRAENPPDNAVTARMLRMRWTLLLDDRETIHGAVEEEIVLPSGQPVVIPIPMRLDLLEFFDGPARSLVEIALAAAGRSGRATTVRLRAVPTIDTPLGRIEYPGEITIAQRVVGGR